MKTIELVADVEKDGKVFLNLSAPTIIPGKHKFLIVIEENLLTDEEFENSDETGIEDWVKEELDKREERMKNDPHPGYTWEEVKKELERRNGKKIQI